MPFNTWHITACMMKTNFSVHPIRLSPPLIFFRLETGSGAFINLNGWSHVKSCGVVLLIWCDWDSFDGYWKKSHVHSSRSMSLLFLFFRTPHPVWRTEERREQVNKEKKHSISNSQVICFPWIRLTNDWIKTKGVESKREREKRVDEKTGSGKGYCEDRTGGGGCNEMNQPNSCWLSHRSYLSCN